MFAVNNCRFTKKTRNLVQGMTRKDVKLWVLPPMICNTQETAESEFEKAVAAREKWLKQNLQYVATHRDGTTVAVVEGTETIDSFRLTEDTPED